PLAFPIARNMVGSGSEDGRKPMFRTFTPKLALTAILALAISGLAVTAAPATNTVEINSRIIMRHSFPAFHGKVKSPNDACVENRVGEWFKKTRNAGRRALRS